MKPDLDKNSGHSSNTSNFKSAKPYHYPTLHPTPKTPTNMLHSACYFSSYFAGFFKNKK
jgi:hypothetical protein